MKKYFLFGEELCEMYVEQPFSAVLKRAKSFDDFDLYEWEEGVSTPEETLEAFSGWYDWCRINEDEYNKLAKIIY